jgi:hypothetical protein
MKRKESERRAQSSTPQLALLGGMLVITVACLLVCPSVEQHDEEGEGV